MAFTFLKTETKGNRTQETFVGNKCEIYIPSYYIDKSDNNPIAREIGNTIETVGIFWFNVDGKWYELTNPTKMQFEFSSVKKERRKLNPEMNEMEFMVYTLNRGDAFLYNVLQKISLDEFKFFLNKMIEGGKLPEFVPYDKIYSTFRQAMISANTGGIGVSAVSIEIMLSELYRNRHKLSEPFRISYNGSNKYKYKAVRITKIPELNSTFTGIMGEDINNQLISAVVRTREGHLEKEAPLERIIRGDYKKD